MLVNVLLTLLTLMGCALLLVLRLYWLEVSERNHLIDYAGQLLLFDEVRISHEKEFDNFLRASKATNWQELHYCAGFAIARMANRLAAGDPKNPASSSVLGFPAAAWQR